MRKVELGIPLALGMAGTIATLFIGNKKWHTYFGIAWTAASLWHMFIYRKKLENDAKKGLHKMNILKAVGLPSSKLELFLHSVEIGSYLPGRIRVYSKALINNPSLKQKVESELTSYSELDKVTINTMSGSILIEYSPANIQGNKDLVEIEQYVKARAAR